MTRRTAAVAAFVAAAAAMPFLLPDYELYRLTLAGIYAIAILGLNLLIGLSGQFSIGHSAFFALGGYGVAVVMRETALGAYPGLAVAGLAAFAAGYLFGWPALRLSRVHLALATWGLALATPQLLKSTHLEAWTGGVQGITLHRPGAPLGLPLSDDEWWYAVTVVLLLLLIAGARNLMRGRSGRALAAVRDDPLAAAAMGIPVARCKALAFGISAFYAGIGGGLNGLLVDFVAPDTYSVFFAILLLVGAVAGGVRSAWGAVFGGLLIQFLPDLARTASAALSLPAYGLILIGLVYLMPTGLAGAVERLAARYSPAASTQRSSAASAASRLSEGSPKTTRETPASR